MSEQAKPPSGPLPEPWMRGPIAGVPPLIMPVLYTFTHVREDLAKHTAGITERQLWGRVGSLASLGFHLRHIAGSVDRLSSYLLDRKLTEAQLIFLRSESEPGAPLADLLAEIDDCFTRVGAELRMIDPATLYDARWVGRQRLPTNVLGLLVHIAEHTQRHLGQAITTAKLVREIKPDA